MPPCLLHLRSKPIARRAKRNSTFLPGRTVFRIGNLKMSDLMKDDSEDMDISIRRMPLPIADDLVTNADESGILPVRVCMRWIRTQVGSISSALAEVEAHITSSAQIGSMRQAVCVSPGKLRTLPAMATADVQDARRMLCTSYQWRLLVSSRRRHNESTSRFSWRSDGDATI